MKSLLFFRVLGKFGIVTGVILSFVSLGYSLALTSRNPKVVRRRRAKLLSLYSRPTLWLLGIRHALEKRSDTKPGAHFIISNHMSYIDVMIIACYFKASFITSKEIEEDFLLGTICKAAGSHFVDRRSFARLGDEINDIANTLEGEHSVALFPEAAASDGTGLLPFKRALLNAAYQTKSKVLPLALSYTSANKREICPAARDSIAYYGDMDFASHFIRFLKLKSIHAKLVQLEAIDLNHFPDSKDLREHVQNTVKSAFEPMAIPRLK